MTGRRGRRRKQLLDDLKEKREYWKLKEEALERLQTCRKTDCRLNELHSLCPYLLNHFFFTLLLLNSDLFYIAKS